MPKYLVHTTWSGYSRGIATYLVEADNEEAAKEGWWSGEKCYRTTQRRDTEHEVDEVEIFNDQ